MNHIRRCVQLYFFDFVTCCNIEKICPKIRFAEKLIFFRTVSLNYPLSRRIPNGPKIRFAEKLIFFSNRYLAVALPQRIPNGPKIRFPEKLIFSNRVPQLPAPPTNPKWPQNTFCRKAHFFRTVSLNYPLSRRIPNGPNIRFPEKLIFPPQVPGTPGYLEGSKSLDGSIQLSHAGGV